MEARRAGASLPDFPGQIPGDLVTAYQVQDIAISQWHDHVVGWKVGYIAAERRDASGDERLLGPIFSQKLWNATGGTTEFPIYVGGFGAV
ncbi:MAG: 2-keto-4-pentenoate hydratase, partial [Xanthomonas perforans]|nr:2-keto-4-pentenoate hydratase [Xanthomonas perforans]